MSLLLGLHAAAPADAAWEETRRGTLEPLNATVHRQLPDLVRKRDLAGVLALYATDAGQGLTWMGPTQSVPGSREQLVRWEPVPGAESVRDRWEAVFALFASIESSELRIDEVRWGRGNGATPSADVHLVVRGRAADGTRLSLDQQGVLDLTNDGGSWRILRDEVVARTLSARSAPAFANRTRSAGLHDVHANAHSPVFHLFGDGDVRNGSGSAIADVDRDGWEDLFLAGSPDARLLRNARDGTFDDVTVAAGLPRPYPAAASGAVFLDYDNDGWPDLYVAAVAGGDRLFRNTGGGRFVDVTSTARIPTATWGSMATVADYDRDGDLDVYVARMGDHEGGAPSPNYDATNGTPNTLLRNERDGTFTEVGATAGVATTGWDLAAAWGDYDDDGWPDLYVANEFGRNALYRNRGDGTFENRTTAAGVADGGAGMGVAWGDYDGDGDLDLFVSNMHANAGWVLFHPDFPAPVPWQFRLLGLFTDEVARRTTAIMHALVRGSTLYRNDGDGSFTDVSDAAGVRDAQWGWAAAFLDYDNDGHLDLYAVNGFLSGPVVDDL